MASQPATVLGPTDAPSLRDSALALARLTAHGAGLPADVAAAAAPQLATQLLERLLKHPVLDVADLRLRRVTPAAVDEAALAGWRERGVGAALLHLRSRGSSQAADRLEAALEAWTHDVKSCAVPRRGVLPSLRPADEDFPAGTAHVLTLTQTQAVVTLLVALAGSAPRHSAGGGRVSGQPLFLDTDGPPLPRHDGLHLPRSTGDAHASAGSATWRPDAPSDRPLRLLPAQTSSPLLPPPGQVGLFGAATPAGGLVSTLHGELWQAHVTSALPLFGGEPRTPGGTHDVAPTRGGKDYDDDEDEVTAASGAHSDMWVTAGHDGAQSGTWAVVPSWDDGLTPAQTAALPRGTWGCESPHGDAAGFGAMYGQLWSARLGPNATLPAAWSADSVAGYALDAVRGNAGAARRLAGVGGVGRGKFQHHSQLMPRAPGTSAGAVATVLAPLLAAGGHRRVVEAFIQAHRGGAQDAVVLPGRQASRSVSCAAAVALATALAAHTARVDACLTALPVAVAVRRGGAAASRTADIAARPPTLLELAAHTAGLRRQLAHLATLCADIDKNLGSEAAVLTALHAAASDVAHEAMAPLLRRLFAAALTPRSSSLFDQAFGVSDAANAQPQQEVPPFLADAAHDAAQAAAALRLMARLPGCAAFLEACRQVRLSMGAATRPMELPATLLTAHTWHEAHTQALSSRAAVLSELQAAAQRGMSGPPEQLSEPRTRSSLWDDGAEVAQPQGPSQQDIAALFGSVVAVRRTRFGGDTLDDASELQAIRARAAAGRLSRGAGLADLVPQPSRRVSSGADGEPHFGRGQGLRSLTAEPEPVDAAEDAGEVDAPLPTLEEPPSATPADDEPLETEPPSDGQEQGGVVLPPDDSMPPAALAGITAQPDPVAPTPHDAPCLLSLALLSAVAHPLARQRAAACAASVAAAWAHPCRLAVHVSAIHDFLLLGRGDFADALLDALLRRLKRTTRDRGAALRVADAAAALAEALGSLGVPGEFVSAHMGVEAPLPGAGGMSSQDSLSGLDAFRLRYDPVAIAFATSSWVASMGAGAPGAGAAPHALAPPEGDILRAVLPPTTLRTYSDAQVALLRLRHACRAAMEARGAAMEAACGAGSGTAGPSAMSASDARTLCACAHVAVRVTQALCDHVGAEMKAALRAVAPDAPSMATAPSLLHLTAAHGAASARAARVCDLGHVAVGVRAASLAALATVFDFRAVLLMPANASTAAALAAGAAVRTAAGTLASACRAAEGVAVTEGKAKGDCHEADILARLDLGEQLLADSASVK